MVFAITFTTNTSPGLESVAYLMDIYIVYDLLPTQPRVHNQHDVFCQFMYFLPYL